MENAMQKLERLTLKILTERTGAPFYIIRYLYLCPRLPILKDTEGRGNPIIFHPDSIEIVKDHLRKNILK